MTQEQVDIGETYRQITNAEKQALMLEKMLDDLDSKMDSILEDIEKNKIEAEEAKKATEDQSSVQQ